MTSSPSSHRQSLSFLVSQNNQGLTHLKNGNITVARKCFIDALHGAQIGQLKKVNTFSNAANANANDASSTLTCTTTAVTTTLPLPSSSSTSGGADSLFDANNFHCGNKDTTSSNNKPNQEGNPSPLQETSSSSLSLVANHGAADSTVARAVTPECNRNGEGNRKRKNYSTTTTTEGEGDFTAAATVVPSPSTTTKRRIRNSHFREELFSRLQTLPTTSKLQDQGISIFMDLSQQQQQQQFPAYSANMALIYSVIIYNMGLAYHIRGRQCQNETFLRTAMDLYDKAHSIVLLELVAPVQPAAAPVVRTNFDNDVLDDEQYQQHQQSSSTSTATTTSTSTTTIRRILLVGGLDRNPIVDLLRLSLLKQMAEVQKSLSNFQAAETLAEEISAFILSVGREFIYRDSRVTELMRVQVGCFFMFAISLKQQRQQGMALLAPAA